MQHVFNGMTLLDYSINSALALTYITLSKKDYSGLITFDKEISTHVPISKNIKQLHLVTNALYNETATFVQSDYAALYSYTTQHIKKRSLFVIYTTFDSMMSMERQLLYLKNMSSKHVVLVVFFVDSELESYIEEQPEDLEGVYSHVIAETFSF